MLDATKLRERLKKFEAVLEPKSGATDGERANAEAMAEKLRNQLGKQNTSAVRKEEYKKLVEKGKKIAGNIQTNMWDLAETVYVANDGWGDLRKYAEDINVDYITVKQCNATFKAWCVEDGKIGRRPPTISFWAAFPLNTIEDRRKIALQNPNLSRDKAREKAREYKARSSKETNKREKKASKSVQKKGTDDTMMEHELCSILKEFLDRHSQTHELLRKLDYGKRGTKKVLTELINLRSRVDGEIAWLETVNRLQ